MVDLRVGGSVGGRTRVVKEDNMTVEEAGDVSLGM